MFRRIVPAVRLAAAPRLVRFASSVQPPVQLFGIDGTYATALYVASAKESSLEATEKALGALKTLLAKDPATGRILADPTLSAETKADAVNAVTAEVKGDKILKGFLDTLSANGRLGLLPDVINQFQVLTDAHHGLVSATVTSVKALDSANLKRIEKVIAGSKYVGQGKTLKLENIVDPSIRGGLVVSIGDRTVDASVATKLQRYNALLNETV